MSSPSPQKKQQQDHQVLYIPMTLSNERNSNMYNYTSVYIDVHEWCVYVFVAWSEEWK